MNDREKTASRVAWVGFGVNLILTLLKFIAGVFGCSGAMIADAVHSFSDFATDIVVLISVKYSCKPADRQHNYGHGKYETFAVVVVAAVLVFVGVGIFRGAIVKIWLSAHGEYLTQPKSIALVAAVLSIVVKEWLYRYTLARSRRINSPALRANAWHHRSDALTSVGTMIGIGGAILLGEKWHILDPVAAVIVSLFIFKVAIEILAGSVRELVEESLSSDVEAEILGIVTAFPEVTHPHNLRTRRIGSDIAVDLHIRVAADMRVDDAHAITARIEAGIRERFDQSAFISIHIEPEHSR